MNIPFLPINDEESGSLAGKIDQQSLSRQISNSIMTIQAKKHRDHSFNETLHEITEIVLTLEDKRRIRMRLYQECPNLEYFTIISHKAINNEH